MNHTYIDTKYMMTKSLSSMINLLNKVEEERIAKEISNEELMDARLTPDMFPFVRQVQIMSDNAKGSLARLAGVDIPSMEDTESTLPQLISRLEKTKLFIDSISDEALTTADERKIILPYFSDKYQTAADYVRDYALPNFYFHFVTAYAILRMKGFSIGKIDFISSLNLKDL